LKPHNRNVADLSACDSPAQAGKLRRYIRNNISTIMLFPV
jgi:hypothetical protein